MGHANLENLSEVVVRHLYAKGKASIQQMVDFAIKKGETLHASEGQYDQEYMISMGIEEVVSFLSRPHSLNRSKATPIIEIAYELTPAQTQAYNEWVDADPNRDVSDWDEEDYQVFDSIAWQFASGWRKHYADIPLLGNVTH